MDEMSGVRRLVPAYFILNEEWPARCRKANEIINKAIDRSNTPYLEVGIMWVAVTVSFPHRYRTFILVWGVVTHSK